MYSSLFGVGVAVVMVLLYLCVQIQNCVMESKKVPLVDRKYLLPFVLITSLFFLWGFAHAILDVLNKHFQDALVMSKTHSALVQVMLYSGYFVMAIPAGLYLDRFGYRRGVILGLILYGIGALLFIPGEWLMSFEFFLFSLFVIGCGLTFLETAANPYVTELGDKATAASRLNLAQSFNGLGCICAPIVGGLFVFGDNASVAMPYMYTGIIVLLVALVFSRVKLPEIPHAASGEGDGGGVRSLARHFPFVFGVAALFFYEISEISINSFFINYVVDDGWFSKTTAAAVLSFGGLGLFMCGRFAGSWVMSRVRAELVLLVCATATVITTGLVVLDLGVVSLSALFAGYLFESIMFPTIFAISLRGVGAKTKRASSFLMMTPIGGAVGPMLMGAVADASTMSVSFTVPFAGFVVVFLFALYTVNRSR